jgi:uncharacterized protein
MSRDVDVSAVTRIYGRWTANAPTLGIRPKARTTTNRLGDKGGSPISGDGLFARAAIPAGAVVSRLGGRLVTREHLDGLLARGSAGGYVDTITVTDRVHLLLPPGQANGKGNHSCDPNLWWTGAYALSARRAVARDEELTNDYATSTGVGGFAMACRCGSALCRGVVTGQDWQRDDLRRRYGDHWVPGLLQRVVRP